MVPDSHTHHVRRIFDGQIAPSQPTQVMLKLLTDHGSDITSRGADQLTCEEMLIAPPPVLLILSGKSSP